MDDAIKTRLLVVDDEEVEIIVRLLSPLGYEIATAFDGDEAISRSREFKPNFVILNIMMPRMIGLHAAPEILKILPECKIIFTTSGTRVSNPEFIKGYEEDGFDVGCLLGKPFSREDLIEKLRFVGCPV
jgi:CheY-like chemotaxis protein